MYAEPLLTRPMYFSFHVGYEDTQDLRFLFWIKKDYVQVAEASTFVRMDDVLTMVSQNAKLSLPREKAPLHRTCIFLFALK
jgi:hypothetical protein